jgi:xylan 1,4-beta-xylosidase
MTARAHWESNSSRRRASQAPPRHLPAPSTLTARAGSGHVSLEWWGVGGAAGYLIHHGPGPDGPWTPLDHHSRDVLAHPGPRYADTTGEPGVERYYAIAAVAGAETEPGPLSLVVSATPTSDPRPVRAHVDVHGDGGRLQRVWQMVGSERLSQLYTPGVGDEFAEALALARDELGATRVRAHAILHDDLGVYRFGEHDFAMVDAVYDRVLELGLRPVVELSFMPRELAADPGATVFEYGAGISVPRDWDAWGALCGALAAHLVERYGIDEVARWGFEVWNEANLEVFWTGTREEYFRLYDLAAEAVKAVDERLPVGGPATAAAGWIPDFLDHVVEHGSPLDFLTTHTYGNLPLDVRESLRVRSLDHVEVWWTEWGVTPTHFYDISDTVFSATFLLHGMKSAQGRADALAYWVVSDHFEELGRPPALLHGGFGLLTVGNLRKPRWWALALAQQLGDELLPLTLEGDGAGTLVDGWAARGPDGAIDVLLWNATLDQTKAGGDPLLDRTVTITGLPAGHATLARVDATHSNLAAHWHAQRPWPTETELDELRAADRLDVEDLGDVGGEVTIDLPMPGIARLRLT